MTKQIEGVPESITRKQYADLISSLGLDPHLLVGLRFGRSTITAIVKARDENGNSYEGVERNTLARHTIEIKVIDR